MPYDLVIKNGRIFSGASDFVGDLAVDGERIAALGQALHGTREIDATGKYVLPGAIDGHVHIRTERPTFRYEDDFATGTLAAAFGGTTTIVDQIQVECGRTLNDALDARLAQARGQTAVDYAFHMNIREPVPERLAEIPSIFARGITSFKWFMAIPGWCVPDDFLMRGMHAVAALGGLSIVHAENEGVIAESLRRRREAGGVPMAAFNQAYPSAAEGAAATLALAMAEVAGTRLLIYHITAREVVEALLAARRRGVRAYGEVCLAYLLFDESVYHADPVYALTFLLTPPLRDAEHQHALWQGLADGTLDIISTDHALMRPAPVEQALEIAAMFGIRVTEAERRASAWRSPDGTPRLPRLAPGGVEVRLPLAFDRGVAAGRLDVWRWVDACCVRPARIFDLHAKGRLLPGFDADVVVFDPQREVTYSTAQLHSNSDYSVYDGMTARGAVDQVFSRGRLIVDGDRFLGDLSHGRYVARTVAGREAATAAA